MQFDLFRDLFSPRPPRPDVMRVGAGDVPLLFVRNSAARRYVLRVNADGAVRITIPRRGSKKEARAVAHRHAAWIEKQLRQQQATRLAWGNGTAIWFRGERTSLLVDDERRVAQFADQSIQLNGDNLRAAVERHLRQLAVCELEQRTRELAAQQDIAIRRITVRDQRSRWGSCSVRGTISLSWRLILMPDFVRDYIILHELMHTREMNHSARFWRHVKNVFPNYRAAELWLKRHQRQLR